MRGVAAFDNGGVRIEVDGDGIDHARLNHEPAEHLEPRLLPAGGLEGDFCGRVGFEGYVIDRLPYIGVRFQDQPDLAVGSCRQGHRAEQFLDIGKIEDIEAG